MDLVAIGTNVVIGVNVLIAEIAEVLLLIQYFEKTVECFLDVLVFSDWPSMNVTVGYPNVEADGVAQHRCRNDRNDVKRIDMHAFFNPHEPRSCHNRSPP